MRVHNFFNTLRCLQIVEHFMILLCVYRYLWEHPTAKYIISLPQFLPCLQNMIIPFDLKELLYTSHTYNFSTSACHVFDETLRKWMDLNNVCK